MAYYPYGLRIQNQLLKSIHMKNPRIFSNPAGNYFAEKLLKELFDDGFKKIETGIKSFANTEKKIGLLEKPEIGYACVVGCAQNWEHKKSIDENLADIYRTIEIADESGAKHISVIIPYLPYSRQDKSHFGNIETEFAIEGVSARYIPRHLKASGATDILTVDVHSQRSIMFAKDADIPLYDISSIPMFTKHIKTNYGSIIESNSVIISPDDGGIVTSKECGEVLSLPVILGNKIRDHSKENVVVAVELPEDINVKGKYIFIFEDMIDTGGTLVATIKALENLGVAGVYIVATHPIFGGKAKESLGNQYSNGTGPLKKVFGSDSVYHGNNFAEQTPWFDEISSAPIFAEAVRRIYNRKLLDGLVTKYSIV